LVLVATRIELSIQCGELRMRLPPNSLGILVPCGAKVFFDAGVEVGSFCVVRYCRSLVARELACAPKDSAMLWPQVRQWLFDQRGPRPFSIGPIVAPYLLPILAFTEACLDSLREKSSFFWHRLRALELLGAAVFAGSPGEESVVELRRSQVAWERALRVWKVLEDNLEEPPSLSEIARQVGCSPFHLSRTFSKKMGLSISAFLRRLRIQKAAALLSSGRYNVTEAALAVGYRSVSAFSRSFCEVIGSCPCRYALLAQAKAKKAQVPQGGGKAFGVDSKHEG
jgi:AraC-like DNA-binding protein